MHSNNLKWLIYILFGGFLLSFLGLYNGYPFAYPDTGTYVFTGFSGEVPIDRPLTYGLFIRHVSMQESLFWVMYAQGILTSLCIYLFMRHFLPSPLSPALFIGTILVLTACTNISVYVSYIMPDLFTPIFYACIILLLLADLSVRRQVLVGALGWLALIMHNSHLLAGTVIALLLLLASIFPRFRPLVALKRTFGVALLVASGWLTVMSIHYAYSGKFAVQQAAHVFTMARLHEMGLLKPYLDKACPAGKEYEICAFRDSLPEDFLWSSNSPAQKDGGWMAHQKEYDAIIFDILTTPKYFKDYLIHTLNGTARQLCYFRAEDINKWRENTPPFGAVQIHFPQEMNEYKFSHQNHRNWYLNLDGINTRQQYLFFGFILLVVLVISQRWWKVHVPHRLRLVLVFSAGILVINAFVCSTFSTVVSRYQGRVIWLAILAGLIVLYQLWQPILESIIRNGNKSAS